MAFVVLVGWTENCPNGMASSPFLAAVVAAQVWNTQTKRLLRTITGHAGGVWAMQYQGNRLVTGATDRRLHVYDLRTGERIHTLIGHDSTIRCLQVTESASKPQFFYRRK